MSSLALGQAVVNDPGGNFLTVSVTLFFGPGNAGATIALRDAFEWQDDTAYGGEIMQITSRQSDGSDLPIPAMMAPIGSFSSNGVQFDPAMSSITYGVFAIGAFTQWVMQVIFF
jgi:hypothetical protein